jgi:hypothetical protein
LTDYSNTLTEKDVQQIALRALRSYYRFRVKAGAPVLESDVRGAGGIIADVSYSFPQEDGSRFTATLEATAADTKEEVYFQKRLGLLLVDSLAVGSVVTGAWFFWTSLQGWGLVVQWSTLAVLALLIGAILLTSGVFALLARNARRYRYIYAVEQFKQYYADEQWIAVSKGVFPDSQNRYFQELREQCVQCGFGLMQIDRTGKAQLIITPARKDVFDNQRSRINLFTVKQLKRLQQGGAQMRDQVKKITAGMPLPTALATIPQSPLAQLPKKGLEKLPAPLRPSDPEYLFRFKRSYQNQEVAMVFALGLIATVFIRELPLRPVRYVSRQVYTREVLAAKEARGPAVADLLLEPYDTLRPFDTTVVPYPAFLRSERMIADGLTPRAGNEILIGMFANSLILYDCERLYNLQQPKYLIQEGIYPDFERASQRMSQLLAENLEVNCLWMGCFGEQKNQYVLYFGLLQNTLPEAQNVAKQYQNRLNELQLYKNVTIRMLAKRGSE